MKPSVFQIAMANDWLTKIWVGGIVGVVIAGCIFYSLPIYLILGFSLSAVGLTLTIAAFGAIAYFTSIIAGCCLFPRLYRIVERANGAPFHEGHKVEIMRKPNCGRTGVIKNAGDSRFGVYVTVDSGNGGAETLNLPWHSIRSICHDAQ